MSNTNKNFFFRHMEQMYSDLALNTMFSDMETTVTLDEYVIDDFLKDEYLKNLIDREKNEYKLNNKTELNQKRIKFIFDYIRQNDNPPQIGGEIISLKTLKKFIKIKINNISPKICQ